MPGLTFSQADKRRAVAAFMVSGRDQDAADEIGASHTTIHRMRKKEWWKELEKEIAAQLSRSHVAKLHSVIQEANDELLDRLRNGDTQVLSNGKVVRFPVKARDASFAANLAYEKLRLVNNQPTSIKQDQGLVALAQTFQQIAEQYSQTQLSTGYPQANEVIDVTPNGSHLRTGGGGKSVQGGKSKHQPTPVAQKTVESR